MLLLLGLLLAAAAAAFTGLLISGNLSGGPHYTVSVLGHSIATMTTLEAFLSGAALALIFCFGLWTASGSARRARRRRVRDRELREQRAAAGPGGPAGYAGDEPEASGGRRVRARHSRHLFGH